MNSTKLLTLALLKVAAEIPTTKREDIMANNVTYNIAPPNYKGSSNTVAYATNQSKVAAKAVAESEELRADELIETRGPRGYLNSTIYPWVSDTAGKAHQLARAAGEETPFSLRRPISHALLHGISGIGLGAGMGAGLGALAGRESDNAVPGAVLGAGIGGYLGEIGGLYGTAPLVKRRAIRKLQKKYDEAEELSSKGQEIEHVNLLKKLLLPTSGAFNRGRMDLADALREAKIPVRRTGAHLAETFVPFAVPVNGLINNFKTDKYNR